MLVMSWIALAVMWELPDEVYVPLTTAGWDEGEDDDSGWKDVEWSYRTDWETNEK